MNIYERVRHVRKDILHITQEAFGKPLGLTRANIANIEASRIAVTERVILSICKEYDIDETWLRTGEGAPQLPRTRSQVIMDFAADLIKDDNESFRRKIIEALAVLDTEDWEALETIANKLIKKD